MSKKKAEPAPLPAGNQLAASGKTASEIVPLMIEEGAPLAKQLAEQFSNAGIVSFLEMAPGESVFLAVLTMFGLIKDKDPAGKLRNRVYWLCFDWRIESPVIVATSPGFGRKIAMIPPKTLGSASVPFTRPENNSKRWDVRAAAARPFTASEKAILARLQPRIANAVNSTTELVENRALEATGPIME